MRDVDIVFDELVYEFCAVHLNELLCGFVKLDFEVLVVRIVGLVSRRARF
jgi:hypothetical protein